jgi:hypothetical protein
MKWVIDVSVWQNMTPAIVAELKNHNLAGVIIRCAQGTLRDNRLTSNVKVFRDAGIPYGVYQWVDPTQDPVQQAMTALALQKETGARFIAGDFEQYWADWGQWRNKSITYILTDQQIYDHTHAYLDCLKSHGAKIVGYSANWFIKGWAPSLKKLMAEIPYYWNASYITWIDPAGDNWCTWAEFEYFMQHLPKEPEPVPGVKTAIWQINYMTINRTMSIDQNVIYNDAVFADLFGTELPTPYPVPDPLPIAQGVVSAVWGLRVRSGPGVQFPHLRSLIYGTKIDIFESVAGWGKIAYGKEEWISLAWVKQI